MFFSGFLIFKWNILIKDLFMFKDRRLVGVTLLLVVLTLELFLLSDEM